MNTVTSGLGADVEDRIPDAGSFAEKDLVLSHQAQGESIHQRVERISVVERDLAADGRYAKGISVMRDAGDYSRQERPISCSVPGMIQRAESQTVQRGDRTRPHREYVAEDTADTGSCALKRFDERGVIVRFN